MAGLCALRILFLCTGIIALADSYNSSFSTSSAYILPTPTTIAISKTNDPQSYTTSRSGNESISTMAPGITATDKPPTPTPVECSYNISPIRFGLQIDLTNSPDGTYSVTFTEKGKTGIGKNNVIQHPNQTSLHPIEHLKPCTEYKHAVEFIDSTGKQTPCNYNGTKTVEKTTGTGEDDVTDGSCISGHVCYKSRWDISSSISASNNVTAKQCSKDPKEFCIKPGINYVCTNLTTTFTSGKCLKVPPFSRTATIPFEFLDVSEINKEFLTGLPLKVKPELPTNCENLTVDYSCWENGKPDESKNLTMLEPFTNYSCKGLIKQNNVTHTFHFKVNVSCDVTTKINEKRSTNTSIHLSWTTTSQRCKDVLTNYPEFKYDCSCVPLNGFHGKSRSRGGTCEIHHLDPFTDYSCEVQPVYAGRPVGSPDSVPIMTDIGTPGVIRSLTVTVKDHNIIIVKCDPPNKFNGLKKKYVARLRPDGGDVKEEIKNECSFVLNDLSYSTKHHLEVAAYNGRFEGKVEKKEVDTLYNYQPVIGVLIFFMVLFGLVVPVTVYKLCVQRRRPKNGVNEGMMLEETAIYVNMPRPR